MKESNFWIWDVQRFHPMRYDWISEVVGTFWGNLQSMEKDLFWEGSMEFSIWFLLVEWHYWQSTGYPHARSHRRPHPRPIYRIYSCTPLLAGPIKTCIAVSPHNYCWSYSCPSVSQNQNPPTLAYLLDAWCWLVWGLYVSLPLERGSENHYTIVSTSKLPPIHSYPVLSSFPKRFLSPDLHHTTQSPNSNSYYSTAHHAIRQYYQNATSIKSLSHSSGQPSGTHRDRLRYKEGYCYPWRGFWLQLIRRWSGNDQDRRYRMSHDLRSFPCRYSILRFPLSTCRIGKKWRWLFYINKSLQQFSNIGDLTFRDKYDNSGINYHH